jgi:hypothetical protein
MYMRIAPKYVILYLLLFTIVILLYQLPLYKKTFAESPSFGYQEIRDELFDIIDMNTCVRSSQEISANKCTFTSPETQSIDIVAVDYFDNQKILNATIWLISKPKENTSDSDNISNYGMFIDADSNQKTGWQGIDYQVEVSENNGKFK